MVLLISTVSLLILDWQWSMVSNHYYIAVYFVLWVSLLVLLYVCSRSNLGLINSYNCYIPLLMHWPLYHYIMPLSAFLPCLKFVFCMNIPVLLFLWWPFYELCLFCPFTQSLCIFKAKVSHSQEAYYLDLVFIAIQSSMCFWLGNLIY